MGKIKEFFKNAFNDMKQSAKDQHEVDKANFEAVKAESKANFEANRATNTFRKAKEDSKKVWDEAHMSPKERSEKVKESQQKQIAEANARKKAAEEKYNEVKVNKK